MTDANPGVTRQSSTNGALALLLTIYTLNYLDRQIVNILAEPIKIDLGLADWQLGLLTGLAFAIFYTVLGIPLARYADRPGTNRPKLIAVCLVIWSGMTAICGLMTNFVQLLLARIGVGIGEAGSGPASHSLISDIIPRDRRASAMAIYSMGVPLGKLFGLLIGGVIAHWLGWRLSFILVGLPGIAVAIIAWKMLPEPRAQRSVADRQSSDLPFLESLRGLLPISSFWMIILGGAFMSFLSYGQTAFLGSFLIRVHGVDVQQAGIMLGLALGGSGALGTWLGGRLTDRLAQRDVRAYSLVPAVTSAIGTALFVWALLAEDLWTAIIVLGAATALTSVWYGPIFATVQNLVQPAQRAMAAAIFLFFANLIGLGLGPLTFGVLSDALNHGIPGLVSPGLGPANGLRYALILGSLTTVISVIFFCLCARTIRRDLK